MTYRERLWPSPWLLIACVLVIPAGILVFAPMDLTAGIVAGVGLYVAAVALLLGTTPVVGIGPDGLRAGRAQLPLEHVGEAVALTGAEAVAARGPQLDARAFTLFRGWVPGVVRVVNTDSADPAPYWLISAKRPAAFAAAVRAALAQRD